MAKKPSRTTKTKKGRQQKQKSKKTTGTRKNLKKTSKRTKERKKMDAGANAGQENARIGEGQEATGNAGASPTGAGGAGGGQAGTGQMILRDYRLIWFVVKNASITTETLLLELQGSVQPPGATGVMLVRFENGSVVGRDLYKLYERICDALKNSGNVSGKLIANVRGELVVDDVWIQCS